MSSLIQILGRTLSSGELAVAQVLLSAEQSEQSSEISCSVLLFSCVYELSCRLLLVPWDSGARFISVRCREEIGNA